jgi:hypothetical protein
MPPPVGKREGQGWARLAHDPYCAALILRISSFLILAHV